MSKHEDEPALTEEEKVRRATEDDLSSADTEELEAAGSLFDKLQEPKK